MALLNPHKSGDTFSLTVNMTSDVLVSELKSQARDGNDALLGEFTITGTETAGQFILSMTDTSNWNHMVYMDIRRTVGGVVTTSETMEIPIVRSITHE